MCTEEKLPDNDPRIIAWKNFKSTHKYKDARYWVVSGESHIEGSLWAVFLAGYEAAKSEAQL